MKFLYQSTRRGAQVELSAATVAGMRAHLKRKGFSRRWTTEQLMDAMLEYRGDDDSRPLINHLSPMYCYLAEFGELWPEGGP